MMISKHIIISYFTRYRDFYLILITSCFLTLIATVIIESNNNSEYNKEYMKDEIKDSYSIDSIENDCIKKPVPDKFSIKKNSSSYHVEFNKKKNTSKNKLSSKG